MTDEELLERYFTGEATAFEELFRRHAPRVRGYAYNKGISASDCDDVTQIVFEKLHRSIHSYRHGEPALPWLFTIAHNTIVDWHRARVNHSKLIAAPTEGEPSINLDRVEAEVDKLSAEQRQVVALRMQDLSFREISAKTGRSEVSLRKVYQRAIDGLRKTFGRRE